MSKDLKYFIIGSSLPICFITYLYNGKAFANAGRPSSIPYEYMSILIPLVFGLMNVLMYHLNLNSKNSKWLIPIFVGALTGFIFSSIGRFGFGLPKKLFGFNDANEHHVHIYAMILYALIFTFIVQNVNKFMFA